MSLTAKIVQQAVTHLLDFIYPPQCLACHTRIDRARHYLCPACWQRLTRLPLQCLQLDEGEPLLYSIALYDLDPVSRALVHALKYRGVKNIARPLAEKLAGSSAIIRTVEAFVPVPLHKVRYRERGYNQAELLARELARLCDIPLLQQALTRTRYTAPQAKMNKTQRQQNVAGVFKVNPGVSINAKRIGLVDDVFTTGQTMKACAQALLQSGADSVVGLSVLRVSDMSDIS